MVSLEENNILVFYHLSVFEICLDNRGGIQRDWMIEKKKLTVFGSKNIKSIVDNNISKFDNGQKRRYQSVNQNP